MASLDELVSRTALFYDDGSKALILPEATGTLAGAGLYDFCASISRPLAAEDLAQLDLAPGEPVADRLIEILKQLFDQVDLLDTLDWHVAYNTQLLATLGRIVSDAGAALEFAKAVETSYVDYARDYIFGYIHLVKGIFDVLVEAEECETSLQLLTVAALVAAIDPDQDVDFPALLAEAQLHCPLIVPALSALQSLVEGFRWLRDHPVEVLHALADLQGEVAIAVLELLRDAKIRDWVTRFVNDHVALGQMLGTILGFVIWDIIVDEVISLGLGKVARGVKWMVK